MVLDVNGNLGIGTTSPQQKLHIDEGSIRIEKTTDPTIEFNNGSANRASMFYDTSEETFVLNHADADANQLVLTSGNNVGIGTNSPSATLNVYSAISGADLFNVEGTYGSLFSIADNLSGVLMNVNTIAGLPVLEIYDDYSLIAGRYNQNDFVISSSGNIGIGTDSPSDKLSILASPNSLIFGAKDTTRNNHIFQLLADDSSGNGELRLYANSATGTHAKNVEIAANGSSYFLGGNVGIGTTSPSEKFHVYGTAAGDGALIGNVKIGRWEGNADYAAFTHDSVHSTSTSYALLQNSNGDSYLNTAAYLNFRVNNVNSMQIYPDKSVKMYGDSTNTTWTSASPTLAIKRSDSAPYISFHADTGGRLGYLQFNNAINTLNVETYSDFIIRTNGLERMTVNKDGLVGIGTTSPGCRLDVLQDTTGTLLSRVWNTNTSGSGLSIFRIANSSNSNNGSRIEFSDNNYYVGTITADRTNGIQFFTGNQTSPTQNFRMEIDPNGNVGIGTTSPDSALHVYSSATTDHTLKMESTAGNSSVSIIANTTTKVPSVDFYGTSTIFGRIGIDRTSNIITGLSKNDMFVTTTQSSNKLHFATNYISRMTVDPSGNVGIGKTDPNSTLHVYSATSGTDLFNVEGTNGSLFSIVDSLSGSLMSVNNIVGLPIFEVFDDDTVIAGRYGENDFYLSTSGDIGVGTSNPTEKLHVDGSIRVSGAFYDSSNSPGSNTKVLLSTTTGTAWTEIATAALQGVQGTTGATGSQGVQGTVGSTGSQGVQGTVGSTGSQGVQGTVGSTGSQGVQGTVGSTGSQGVQGTQGLFGFGNWTPILTSNIRQVSPGVFDKIANNGGWNERVYSAESFYTCYISYSVNSTSSSSIAMLGLTTDPTASTSYTTIDYAWYNNGTNAYIYENGTSIGTFLNGTFTTSTKLSITYDGANIKYYADGVLKRTVARTSTTPLHFSSSIHSTSGDYDVEFGPMGQIGTQGVQGTQGTQGVQGLQGGYNDLTTSLLAGTGIDFTYNAGSDSLTVSFDGGSTDQILYRDNSNVPNGSNSFTFNETGTIFDIDDIRIDNNTISSTASNIIIDPSGDSYVGINTSSPNAMLHVYSSVSGDDVFNVEGTQGSLFGVTDNLSGTLMSVNTIAGLPVLEVNSDYSVTAGRFNQNDFTISSSGNVGIGTDTTIAKLAVRGENNSEVISVGNNAGSAGTVTGNTRIGISHWSTLGRDSAHDYSPIQLEVQEVDSADYDADFFIRTRNGDNDIEPTRRFTINAGGNVGIGTDSPSEKLHVYGTAAGDGALIGNVKIGRWDGGSTAAVFTHNDIQGTHTWYGLLQSSDGHTYLNAASNKKVHLRINNANAIILDTDKSVKMFGDSTNSTWSDASPNLAIKRSNSAPLMSFHSDTGTRLGYLQFNANGANGIVGNNYQDFVFHTNSLERMRIHKDGYVDFSNFLRIDFTNDERGIIFEDSTGYESIYMTVNDGQGNFNMMLGVNHDGNRIATGYGLSKILFQGHSQGGEISLNAGPTGTAGASAVYNIGLSLDSDDQKLRIGNPNNNIGLAGAAGNVIADVDGDLITRYLRARDANGIQIGDDSDTLGIFVKDGGDVGIGTGSPSEKLHVAGDVLIGGGGTTIGGTTWDNGLLRIGTSSDGISIDTNEIYGATDLYLGSLNSSHNIIFRHGNTERMRVASGGNVGIGSINPSQKLQVSGNFRLTGAFYDSNNTAGTSGQVLSSTATGTDWISLSEIQGVDGTGSAGQVAFWSDADTITGESNLYWDSSNDRLGIGTASPTQKLEVNGNIALSNGNNLYFYSLTGYSPRLTNSNEDNDLSIYTNNLERIRVQEGGNVGIGTSSPTEKLEVEKHSTNPVYAKITNSYSTGKAGIKLTTTYGGTEYSSYIWDDWVGTGTVFQASRDLNTGQGGFNWLAANGSSMMNLRRNGGTVYGLGVGGVNALVPLHVKDRASGNDGVRIDYGSDSSYNLRLDGVGGIRQWRGTGSNGGMTLTTSLTSGSWGGDQGGLIAFRPRDTEAARFDGLGNFGIGTDSPAAKLHIRSDSSGSVVNALTLQNNGGGNNEGSQINFVADGGTYGYITTTHSSNAYGNISINALDNDHSTIASRILLTGTESGTTDGGAIIFDVGSERMRINKDGKIGIGTASPNEQLSIGYADASSSKIEFRSASYARQAMIEGIDGQSSGDGHLAFHTRKIGNALERLRITADGNVGIGTTSPSPSDTNAKTLQLGNNLILQNVVGSQVSLSHNAYYDGSSWKRATADDAGAIRFGHLVGGVTFHLAASSTANSTITNWDNSDIKMAITSAGNVGIGTNSPQQKLHVVGDQRIENATDPKLEFHDGAAVGGYVKFDTSEDNLVLSHVDVAGDNQIALANDGNVGIGTASPNAVLHAYGSTPSGTVFNVEGTNGSLFSVVDNLSGVLMSVNNNAGLPVFEVYDDDSIVAGRFAQDDFVISTSGNVGLGTDTPSTKLEVVGNVFANNFSERISTVSISSGSVTLDLSSATIFLINLNANITTMSITNASSDSSRSHTFTIIFTGDGTARTVAWPASVKWPDNSAPTLTSTNGKRDVYHFMTVDAGSTFLGFTGGQNF
jgi:hypothetical protein